MTRYGQRGFTLPELLVFCVVVIAMLAVALAVAHPRDFTEKRRDAERWVAVAQQMQLLQRYVASRGQLPVSITEQRQAIGSEEGMINICPELVPKFADDLLYDPLYGRIETDGGCQQAGALYTTGLAIAKTKDNSVTVSAPGAESGEKISLTKKF